MSSNRIYTATESSLQASLNAQQNLTGSEQGNALNAHAFMHQAIDCLTNGDYSGYLCCMDLAGQFARDARNDLYARTVK